MAAIQTQPRASQDNFVEPKTATLVSTPNPASASSDPQYYSRLVQYAYDFKDEDPAIASFETLQRLNLAHIMNDLARLKADIGETRTATEKQTSDLRRTMHDYVTAIRDFDYMQQLQKEDDNARIDQRSFLEISFPYLASRKSKPYDTDYRHLRKPVNQQTDSIREFLRYHLHHRLAWTNSERAQRRNSFQEHRSPEIYSPFLDRMARFIIAMAGGLSLVVPMLIMSLHASTTKSLITTTVAVLLFSLALSWGIKTDNKDTLTATATYAAVLVVFVGASGTTAPGSTGNG